MNLYIVYLRDGDQITNVYSEGQTTLEALQNLYKRFPKAELIKIECLSKKRHTTKTYRNNICNVNHVKDNNSNEL